ncbi:MAG: hypothetical protein ACI835_005333 [Planctomycetota bacterium]|jgi:hypothetical protein
MKNLDHLACILLALGGRTWGLRLLFDPERLAGTRLSLLAKTSVGLAAHCQVVSLGSSQRRWNVSAVGGN